MEITLCKKENISDLYRLWNICFGDKKETIDMFFEHSFSLDNTVVCLDNNEVISMAFLIPERIVVKDRAYIAYYLYALGTNPEYRKQGIMANVLKYIDKLAVDRNIDYLFLVPASEDLFNYYRTQGYNNAFCQKKLCITRQCLDKLKLNGSSTRETPFNSDEYRNIKYKNIIDINSNLLEKSFVDWRTNEIKLAYEYFSSDNGEVVCSQIGSCFIEHSDSCDKIYDLNFDENGILNFLDTISNHIQSDNIEFYLSKNCCLIGSNQAYYNAGMIKKLKPSLNDLKNTFMGITLG